MSAKPVPKRRSDPAMQNYVYKGKSGASQLDTLRAENKRLQRENGVLARTYAACERMLRDRTEQLNKTDAEVERLRAIADAAFAYVHTPTDDAETGPLYRALQVAVTETVMSASHALGRDKRA